MGKQCKNQSSIVSSNILQDQAGGLAWGIFQAVTALFWPGWSLQIYKMNWKWVNNGWQITFSKLLQGHQRH